MSTETRSNKIYTRTGDQGKTSLIGGSRVSKSDARIETYGTVDELNSIVGMLIHDMRSDYQHLNDIDSTYDVGAQISLRPAEQTSPAASTTQASPSARAAAGEDEMLTKELHEIQCDLFNIGSQLACEDEKFRAQMPNVTAERITELEKRMDEYSLSLKPLKNFILPGGSRSASTAHLARTVCRRAERLCVLLQESYVPHDDGSEYLDANLHSAKNEATAEKTGATHDHLLVTKFLNRLSDYFFVLARFLNARMKIEEPIWRHPTPPEKSQR